MRTPIAYTFIFNLMIIFILIVFAFMAGTMSYYKAFKVNNRIVHSIEKFEGFNSDSQLEIEIFLGSMSYKSGGKRCAETYKGMTLVHEGVTYSYCIYIDLENPKSGEYYNYGVLTYMSIDFPLLNVVNFPVFTRTNEIYKFTNT